MDKETLSNYGWIVICVLVLAVMIALAGPFGNFIANAVKSTTQGLFDVNQNALNAAGVPGLTIEDQEFNVPDGNGGTQTKDPALNPTDIAKTIYTYGDYIYTATFSGNEYGASTLDEAKQIVKQQLIDETGMTWDEILAMLAEQGMTEDMAWESQGLTEEAFVPTTYESWSVKVIDTTKTEYGPILESINGAAVTNMDRTFYDCKHLENIDLSKTSVKEIGYGTFWNCTSLESISLPEGLTTISDNAFHNCTSLTSITIPNGVTNIYGLAFSECTSLENVKLPAKLQLLGAHCFSKCTVLTNVDFSECTSITDTGDYTFEYCTSLKSIDFSGCTSLTTIASDTFDGCTSLTSITLPDSITTIDSRAFDGCTSLESIVLSKELKSIGYIAFRGCNSLASITFEGTVEQWNAITFGQKWNDNVPATEVICSDGNVTL